MEKYLVENTRAHLCEYQSVYLSLGSTTGPLLSCCTLSRCPVWPCLTSSLSHPCTCSISAPLNVAYPAGQGTSEILGEQALFLGRPLRPQDPSSSRKGSEGPERPIKQFLLALTLSASIHRKAKKKRSSGNYVHLAKSHCDSMDLSGSFACGIVNGHGRLQAFVLSQRSVDAPRMHVGGGNFK